MTTLVATDVRLTLMESRKFREWRPRIIRHKPSGSVGTGEPLRAVGKTFKNLGEVPVDKKHFSPAELADAWGVSSETVRTIFREEPGVLKIGKPATKYRRGYITLRIPQEVAERVHRKLAA